MDPIKQTLAANQLQDLLHELPEWRFEEGKLIRDYGFRDFLEAMDFVGKVARLAEREGHHPDIDIRYNRVKLALISHDAGGITQRDADMARLLSGVR